MILTDTPPSGMPICSPNFEISRMNYEIMNGLHRMNTACMPFRRRTHDNFGLVLLLTVQSFTLLFLSLFWYFLSGSYVGAFELSIKISRGDILPGRQSTYISQSSFKTSPWERAVWIWILLEKSSTSE
jgi:hypothetical protein